MVEESKATDVHKESWGETIRTVFYAVLIAIGIRTFAWEPFNIPSESMLPTLPFLFFLSQGENQRRSA